MPESIKKAIESVYRGPPVAERRIALRDLLDLRIFHDFKSPPVTGESFQKMISLHIAIVVRSRNVRRVKIDEIDAIRRHGENVSVINFILSPIVEYDVIEHLYLFEEMFLDG
jgi:hypothetical protein